jgi:hypothetical protein
MPDMAIRLFIPNVHTRRRGNLKGLSHERGWIKSAENLGASPYKRDLLINTTFIQVISLDSPLKGKFQADLYSTRSLGMEKGAVRIHKYREWN